jgi:hypothetical protein
MKMVIPVESIAAMDPVVVTNGAMLVAVPPEI